MNKQLIFFFLFVLFIIYSFSVYFSGTTYDKGISHFTTEAKLGKKLFQEKNCISCHQIYGLGGYMGPELTNIISYRDNDESIARAFLKGGTAKMPNFQLNDEEIDALISYLKYIDKAGNYPPKAYEITPYGTVNEIVTDEK
ncbi:MAG: cytochrome c [Bacteroidetes bacterium]|nr:cytochrome c [Flavobacteriales bacterium]NOG58560.1 cytochrome c [Bacteroidota bacterium]